MSAMSHKDAAVGFLTLVARGKVAEAYLKYLWSDEGQDLAAKHHMRPRSAKVLAKYAREFPRQQVFTVDELFGGWKQAQKEHFDDGGVYDRLIGAAKR